MLARAQVPDWSIERQFQDELAMAGVQADMQLGS